MMKKFCKLLIATLVGIGLIFGIIGQRNNNVSASKMRFGYRVSMVHNYNGRKNMRPRDPIMIWRAKRHHKFTYWCVDNGGFLAMSWHMPYASKKSIRKMHKVHKNGPRISKKHFYKILRTNNYGAGKFRG